MLSDNYKQLRLKILKALMLLITTFLFVFFAQDLYFGNTSLYVMELVTACVGLYFYITFSRWQTTEKVHQIAIVFTNTTFCLLLYVLAIDGFTSLSYIWLTAIPITSYMLNGLSKGQKLTLFYLSIATIILTSKEMLNRSGASFNDMTDVAFLVLLMWILAHFYESANQMGRRELIKMATTDSLTGLNNRHAFYDYFETHKHSKVGIIILDLDFFKAVNDHYSHDAGDYVLTEVARILMAYQSDNLKAFRMGGEEFSLLSFDLSYDELCQVAYQILVAIREHTYVHEGRILELTASFGVEMSNTQPSSLNELMKMADRKLYEAKEKGRNRVVCELTLQ